MKVKIGLLVVTLLLYINAAGQNQEFKYVDASRLNVIGKVLPKYHKNNARVAPGRQSPSRKNRPLFLCRCPKTRLRGPKQPSYPEYDSSTAFIVYGFCSSVNTSAICLRFHDL